MEIETLLMALINTTTFILVGMFFAFKVFNELLIKTHDIRKKEPKSELNKLFKRGRTALVLSLASFLTVILIGYLAIVIKVVSDAFWILFVFFALGIFLSTRVLTTIHRISDLNKFEPEYIIDL